MKNYQDLVHDILENGEDTMDRTGVGTRSVIGRVFQHDMSTGFPAVTTKRLAWKAVVGELLWFMNGSTNVEDLRELTHGNGSDKRTIWDDNYENQAKALGYDNGYLGPVYGHQWRCFGQMWIDQLQNVINEIKQNPSSRRLIVSAWNPEDLDKMALPPCHVLYRFSVRGNKLNLTWYQRSVDSFLGLPFNIASYALLLSIVAKMTGYEPGILTGMLDDCHLYLNHIEQAKQMLEREPRDLPTLKIHDDKLSLGWGAKMIDDVLCDLSVDSFKLVDYNPYDAIKAPMAV